jgi:hypothetical protein
MNQRAGCFILILVAIVIGGYIYFSGSHGHPGTPAAAVSTRTAITVNGYVGGEKLGFISDPAVVKILAERYNITVESQKLGSVAMVTGQTQGKDFLWPASQVELDMYKSRGAKLARTEMIYNSPIVLYSWDFVTDALIKQKIVKKIGDSYYIDNLPKLVSVVSQGAKWKDIGLPQLYGRVSIRCTDPAKSNSGMMFAGLLASVMNGGEVVDDASATATLPKVKTFFGRLGFMEESSADLFTQFLKTGEGANPIIVGYESQLVEFAIDHPEYRDMLRQKIRILYPRPTVWSTHPMIALDDNGSHLVQALQDEQIQKIAWERHGFRSGVMGIQNDPNFLKITGIPERIQYVIPMPKARVVEHILTGLGGS